MRRLINTTLLVLVTLTVLVLIWQLRVAFGMFVISLALAAALRPLTVRIASLGLPRWLAILLVYTLMLATLAGLLFAMGDPLLREIGEAADNMASKYEEIVVTWPYGTAFQQSIAERLPPPEELYAAIAGERGTALLGTIFGVAQGFFSFLGQAFIILILSVYWSTDQLRFEQLWLSLVPAAKRNLARNAWREIDEGVGAYLRSEVVQILLAGLLLGIGYQLMGLAYPLLLALIGSVLLLIPWLGAVLGAILPVLFGLDISPWIALIAGLFSIVIIAVMEFVVEPRFFDRRRYSSLLIVLTMVIMADAYGLVGLIIAPPLAAAVQILTLRLVAMQSLQPAAPPPEQFARLGQRFERLQSRVAELPEKPPELTNLLERTEKLLQEAQGSFENEREEQAPKAGLPS